MNAGWGVALYAVLIVINLITFYAGLMNRRAGIMLGSPVIKRQATWLCAAAAVVILWCTVCMSYYIDKL